MQIRDTKNKKKVFDIIPASGQQEAYILTLVLNGKEFVSYGDTLEGAMLVMKETISAEIKNTSKGILTMRHGEKKLERLIFARQIKQLFGTYKFADISRRNLVKIYQQSL